LYQLTVPVVRVREGPGTNFPVALGGAAQIPRDAPLAIDTISDGEVILDNPWWGHLQTQLGFISMCVLQPQAVSDGETVEIQQPSEEPTPISITPDSPIMERPRAALDQCQRYLVARRARSGAGVYSEDDVRYIARLYFEATEPVGVDPLIAIAQMVVETGALTSNWSQPPHRNPAGLGVTGEPGAGLSFPNWTAAVHAHIGRLLAYTLPSGNETPEQRALIAEALQWRPLPANYRGIAPTLAGLARRWAADPEYAEKIAAKATEIQAFTSA
jgi:hypothetical protein